jgi:proline iminopeptidase
MNSRRCKKAVLVIVCFFVLWLSVEHTFLSAKDKKEKAEVLFPKIEPFKTGYLKVSPIHEIYYELCGNPKGKPVMVLHGGPGYGSYPRLRRYFNPKKFLIVIHDQRGAKKSKPYAETRENKTQYLVEDIEKLRKHLNLEKTLVFGGSWGTTLALVYAETYPENVSGMILRGVFTGTKEEMDFHYRFVKWFFPREYDELIKTLPAGYKGLPVDYMWELIEKKDQEQLHKCMIALGTMELKMTGLEVSDSGIRNYLTNQPFEELKKAYTIDLFYNSNRLFLKDNQVLNDAHKIKHIPVTLINGRYDMATPVYSAHRLHKLLPKSRLIIVESSGHSESEPRITEALVKAVKEFE